MKKNREVVYHMSKAAGKGSFESLKAILKNFDLGRADFEAYLKSMSSYKSSGSVSNLGRRVFVERDLSGVALEKISEFLEHKIPYRIDKDCIRSHLCNDNQANSEGNSYATKVDRIEGIYEILRYHSERDQIIKEYVRVADGKVAFLNFKESAEKVVLNGKIRSDEGHFYCSSFSDESTAPVFSLIERKPFFKEFRAGMILGLDDDELEMVCFRMVVRKIRFKETGFPDFQSAEPHVSKNADRFIRQVLSSEFEDIEMLAKVFRFSGRATRPEDVTTAAIGEEAGAE